MAQKVLVKHKHTCIQSYRLRKTDKEIRKAIAIHPSVACFSFGCDYRIRFIKEYAA